MRRITVTLLLALVAVVLGLAPLALAQQPAQPPPIWQQGRPPEMANSPLAPVASPPASAR